MTNIITIFFLMVRNKETLKEWRNKAKQLQFIESSHKLKKCKKPS